MNATRRPRGSTLSRRRALVGAGTALAGIAASLVAVDSRANRPLHDGRVRIAGGEAGGVFLEFAQLLGASMSGRLVSRAAALETAGSLENLDLIDSGDAELALVVATAMFDRERQHPALGRMYENYLHCVVLQSSDVVAADDLSGRRIGVGAAASGTNPLARRTLAALGVEPATMLDLGLEDGVRALQAGEVEATFFSSGLPVPRIAELAAEVPIRLVDLTGAIPVLNAEYGGALRYTVITASTYQLERDVPAIGVANLLIARDDLDDRLISAIAELLVEEAVLLIPDRSAGVQFLSLESLIDTYPATLHPAAARRYRRRYG